MSGAVTPGEYKRVLAVSGQIGHHPLVNPTAALLWEAARPTPDPEAIGAALESGADVALAASRARAHGLCSLLVQALRLGGAAERAPDALRTEAEMWEARARVLVPEAVRRAVEPLASAGLEPLVWKGPALAARYPDPTLRPMSDLDVIVEGARHGEAVAALEREGWKAVPSHERFYDTGLIHPALPGLPLELHFGLHSWRDRPNRLRSDDLWARRRPIELFGTAAWGLDGTDEVVAVAAHAGKPWHVFTRLLWATDLALVSAGADWQAVRRRVEQVDCRTVVAVGLRLATRLGADPPWWLIELPAARARRRALDEVLDDDWPVAKPERDLQERLRYALTDRPTRAAALVVGEILEAEPGQRLEQVSRLVRRAGRASAGLRWGTR